MNELMSNKGVCRTAPATPGLLNMQQQKTHKGEPLQFQSGGEGGI